MLLFAALYTFAPVPALAGGTVTAQIDNDKISMGTSVIYTIKVEGQTAPEAPELGPVPGFEVTYLGSTKSGTSMVKVVINGKVVQDDTSSGGVIFKYALRPKAPGDYTIPSQTLYYGTEKFQTPEFYVNVAKRGVSPNRQDLLIAVKADKKEAYIGEPVMITVDWYISAKIGNYHINIPWLEENANFIVCDPESQTVMDKNLTPLTVNDNKTVLVSQNQGFSGGKQYLKVSFQKLINPIKPGTVTLPPITLNCEVVTGYKRTRSPFSDDGDSFFNLGMSSMFRQPVTETVFVQSNPIELMIKDVPGPKPEDFNNAVGSFTFTCSASPEKLKVGDPVTLKMTVEGFGDIKNIDVPCLPYLPDFKIYDPEVKVETGIKNGKYYGKAVYEQMLIPKNTSANTIKEVNFTYFDVEKQKYVSIKRGPFHFEVEKSNYTPIALPTQNSKHTQASAKQQVDVQAQGIRYIKTGEGNFHPDTATGSDSENWLLGIFVLALPCAFAGIFVWRQKAVKLETDTDFARSVKASKQIHKRVRECRKLKDDPEAFFLSATRVLSRFIADKLTLPYGAVEENTVGTLLEGKVPPELNTRITDFMQQAQMVKFSGMRPDKTQIDKHFSELEQIMSLLAKKL